MKDFNSHHIYFEKCQFRRAGGAQKALMHLTTVLVPIHEVHRKIHANVPPLEPLSCDLANELLKAARSVRERGIERFDAELDTLEVLRWGNSTLAEEAEAVRTQLMQQREIMATYYPIGETDGIRTA